MLNLFFVKIKNNNSEHIAQATKVKKPNKVLKKTIQLFKKNSHFNTLKKDCSDPTYYIMHPLLRHLTIEKINHAYSSKISRGIFPVEENIDKF